MNENALGRILSRLAESPSGAENWEELYRLLWPYVLARMYRALAGNRYLAEEGVQEVMLRLVRHLDFRSFAPSAISFLSYLRSTCRSVVMDLFRRELRHQGSVPDLSAGEGPTAEVADWLPTPEEQAITRNALERAINQLKPTKRRLAELLAEGRTIDEIVQITKMSKKTAYNNISIVRTQLRQLLFQTDEETP